MNYTIRPMREDEYPLLRDFLYEAIFIPEGTEPPPRSIIDLTELQVYINGFGSEPSDICFVAEVDGGAVSAESFMAHTDENHGETREEAGAVGNEAACNRVVGAIWVRIMDDYGHIADDVPSFAISLYREHRGQGIGTALMTKMLSELRKRGFKRASLAVQKANFAVKLYENTGFKIIDEKRRGIYYGVRSDIRFFTSVFI